MPVYPSVPEDTVLYEKENIYGDKDITLTMLDGAKLNIWGESYFNGNPVGSIGVMPIASQAEAEAGVDNTKAMTPLRTSQAIDAQVDSIVENPTSSYLFKFGDVYNSSYDVRSFGAKGNGVTDDTVAIQAALNSAAATGSSILMPAGRYLISSTLTASGPFSLVGMGPGSVLVASSASFNMIELSVANDGTTIRDLTFQGGASNDSTTQFGISHPQPSTPSANKVQILNCRFIPQPDAKALNDAIKIYSANDWLIDGCYIENMVGASLTNTGYGVLTGRAKRVTVVNCDFRADATHGRHAVYFTVNTCDSTIANNTATGYAHSTFITKSGTGTLATISCDRNLIIGNKVFDNVGDVADQAGISIGGAAVGTRVIGNIIDNVQYAGINVLPGDALYLDDAQLADIVIAGNTITRGGECGIEVQHTLRLQITNNRIHNIAQVQTNVAAITLRSEGNFGDGHNEGTRIVGNYCTGVGRASVEVSTAGTRPPTNHVIVDNDFVTGTLATAIQDTANPGIWNMINTIDGQSAAAVSFVAFDTTPSVKGGRVFRTSNSGTPTTITALDDGVNGQAVDIIFLDGFTTVDFTGTTLIGNGNVDWKPGNGEMMHCTRVGTNWYCQVSNWSVQAGISGASRTLGFFGATPVIKPTVTGAKGSNAALASLLTQLVSLGLITDSSTA